jgi:hypothetical protein
MKTPEGIIWPIKQPTALIAIVVYEASALFPNDPGTTASEPLTTGYAATIPKTSGAAR